ncbi:hypothetical protein CHLNCDRAFT_142385 [Chlorella variabilis]|uniref:VWFA domain-containing protein n=1 Tax=Chlorella variabilis TaxID=554065 RepID=E1Z8F4_CHLVA|nr:hypothetical protein CHLNCDRAFT_142385 [Chlorella variabilis]EFN58081.1 hypothetical protein CHLNCDRAFT_142385 [Chlorella variabilis]|eukprot:XP_005850183.1 hypothetical protein CHLNCDRAFT_142385 [Chlorella variabilis]
MQGRSTWSLIALLALAAGLVAGRPLPVAEVASVHGPDGRQLLAEPSVVLALDAATSDVGPGLTSLENSEGDAAWGNPDDPAMTIQLHNAGYDQAYGGAVVFSSPPEGTAEAGSYGDGKPVGVRDGAWGDEFSALVWYKPGQLDAGANPVLLQVAGADELGDPRASATWRVAGFEDQTAQGSIPIKGFTAQPTYTADSLKDCWVQLAVVKSGPALEFYRDAQPAGTATAAYVVNDYGAEVLALGVDYSRLVEPGSNATGIDPAALSGPLGWLSGSIGAIEVHSRALTAAEIAAKYEGQSSRYSESLCSLESPKPPSTLDSSTAAVSGSGASGSVANTLTMTGGEELSGLQTDPVKQEQLKQAILASLNLPPGYTTDNIQINVVSVTQEGGRRRLQAPQTKVVVEYTLTATPEVQVEVLAKAEASVYLFIRVQQPAIPWWSGPTATICISDSEGACNVNTPPITPPVVIQDCSANVCFLLDGSKSLTNVDGWNDVVASARSIMYSLNDPAAVFDVFWFSNDVEKIGHATGAEVAANNSFVSMVVNTTPDAHGTWMAQAITTCQGVLLEEDTQASRTIVLITDGKPTDPQPTFEAADAAKARGIKMVVVGAGEIDYATLKALASGPQFVFANTNLDSSQLMLMADLASEGVCREEDK